jgi:hypothetical protein
MMAIETLRNTSTDTLPHVLTRTGKEGTGLGHFNVARRIVAGINIIHINIELRVAWRTSLGESWHETRKKSCRIRFCGRS